MFTLDMLWDVKGANVSKFEVGKCIKVLMGHKARRAPFRPISVGPRVFLLNDTEEQQYLLSPNITRIICTAFWLPPVMFVHEHTM